MADKLIDKGVKQLEKKGTSYLDQQIDKSGKGLSCSGPYFQAWLTRIFRKYNIVLGQTRYVPVDAEAQKIKHADGISAMRMQRIWATDLRNWNVSGTHRADRANRKIE